MSRTILVTGGAGFIGAHLCRRLLAEGETVVCLDNFFTGRRSNIEELLGHPRFELMRHDVVQPFMVEADQIYNLACPASPVHYQANPIKTIKVNMLGALHCLGLARRTGARVLLASTSEVYGDPEVHPQPESYRGNVSCVGPRACYDEGKRIAETLFYEYHRYNGTDIRVARIFNTYGPMMRPDDGRVVSNFVVQALEGRPLTIYGDGEQTRSFCFVDDLVDGLVRLMNNEQTIGPVNLGNPDEFTIRELAERIIELTGSASRLVREPLPVDDPTRRRPDIGLARRTLGWRPTVSLAEGLMPTIEYFRSEVAVDRAAA